MIYVIYSVPVGWFFYLITDSPLFSIIVFVCIIVMNSTYYILENDNFLSLGMLMPAIYLSPFLFFGIYCLYSGLQDKVMTSIGIIEKPYLTRVKNGSNAESHIKTLEKAYPNHKPKQVPFGGYVGYYSSSLIMPLNHFQRYHATL